VAARLRLLTGAQHYMWQAMVGITGPPVTRLVYSSDRGAFPVKT
jgi:hypothetical protein